MNGNDENYKINLLQPHPAQNPDMITRTLHQINQLSQKIQTSVQKALNQTTKSQFLSPDTHHQSHPNTSSHPTKQYYKKHEKSSSQPQPVQIPSEQSPSYIRHFMLEEENTLMRQQIKQLKNKQKLYRNQLRDLKKYIKFLQQYNDGLKKQVVVWMTRPVKKQREQQSILQQKLNQYRGRFSQIIAMNRSTKQQNDSTNYNSINYDLKPYVSQQYQFVKPVQAERYIMHQQGSKIVNRHPEQSADEQSQQQEQSMYAPQTGNYEKNSRSLVLPTNKKLNNQPIKCTHNNNPQKNLQCTSCNYLQYQKYRNKFINGQVGYKKPSSKNKNAKISSHNNSRSHHNHNNNNKTLELRPDNIQLGKNKFNTVGRDRKKNSLCECHEQYVRNRYL